MWLKVYNQPCGGEIPQIGGNKKAFRSAQKESKSFFRFPVGPEAFVTDGGSNPDQGRAPGLFWFLEAIL
ncbi:hypothetical protein CHISP_1024 [Chitinispirillum alkaliphilum]|nr:hypothetical protein CHISP_1024 [Chitinispirillum alkaliphilum]